MENSESDHYPYKPLYVDIKEEIYESDDENEYILELPHIDFKMESLDSDEEKEETKATSSSSSSLPEKLPEKSKSVYEEAYNKFMYWRTQKNTESFSESVLLEYFEELSETYRASSLWKFYSMLRSVLILNHNVNIEKYDNLRSFLKTISESFEPKKSKKLTPEEINKFIAEAPDETYLLHKLSTKNAIKKCFVPSCSNTSLSAPSKLYLTVPTNFEKRTAWFRAVGIRTYVKSALFCCEDHFDLPCDVENWQYFKTIGKNILLKDNVVPHLSIIGETSTPIGFSQLADSPRKRKAAALEEFKKPKIPFGIKEK